MADTSLWPVVVGGLLALGGTLAGVVGTAIRDAVQQRHEAKKRRADKFEELVRAIYEFDNWLARPGGEPLPQTASPFAKVQSISSVYFPQFSELVRELDRLSKNYLQWIYEAEVKKALNKIDQVDDGFAEVYEPYAQKYNALLDALKEFAQKEFQ